MRRAWQPDAENRPPTDTAQGAQAPADAYARDGIEVRAVRAVGPWRSVWIAKLQPWGRKRPVWMAIGTPAEMREWWAAGSDIRRAPVFAQTYGRAVCQGHTRRAKEPVDGR